MLSIIIPTLNEEKYLQKTLELIKNENLDEYEVIVADNFSKDKTKEIALSFGCIITKGGLPPVARNNGAMIAKGDLIFFLDADLVSVEKGTLKEGLREFKERDLDVASFPISLDGEKIDKFCYDIYNKWAEFAEDIEAQGSQAILIKKSLHNKIGGFDEKFKIGEDYDYVNRAKKNGFYGRLRTNPFIFSSRRIEKDGRIFYIKYLFAGKLAQFLGLNKTDIYNYKFDHYSEEKKNLSKRKKKLFK